MDAHNVSALCVESLFHTSEERTREIDLGALADLPDTLRMIREMASVGTESMFHIRLLQQKVTDLEAMVAGVQSQSSTTAGPNTDAPPPGPSAHIASKARFSSSAAAAAAAAAAHPSSS
jgi:hypothetical protein